MARRHLHELLSEEQEPFALQSFIDERRCQLRRPFSMYLPASQRQRRHPQVKRPTPTTSPVSDSTRALPSCALAKSRPATSSSSSSSLTPCRGCKRSPLVHLPHEKSPSRLTAAALLLEAAMRIQRQQEQQQSQKKRRRRKKKIDGERSPKHFGLGFLVSVLKRVVVKTRPQRGISGEEEEGSPLSSHAKDLSKREKALYGQGYKAKEADFDMLLDPHCGSHTDGEQRKEDEGKFDHQSSVCCCCCPQNIDDRGVGALAPSLSSDVGSVLAGRVSNSSPSQQGRVPSPPCGPSPDLRTPAASPDRRTTEGQLAGDTGNEGRAGPSYHEEKKEQCSPVSVLDAAFEEEEEEEEEDHEQQHHHSDEHAHHPELEPQEDQGQGEEDDGVPVDSFQRSLAIVQRTKQELLSRIRRFERLADLDPVELDDRFTALEDVRGGDDEEEGEEEDGGRHGPHGVEAPELCELVRVAVLGLPGKIPSDMRRLVLDIAEEERRGRDPVAATEVGVRRRLEAWKWVQSDTIDMMVEMDVRQEGDGWRRFPEQVEAAAAEVEDAVFDSLVDEMTTLTGGGIDVDAAAFSCRLVFPL